MDSVEFMCPLWLTHLPAGRVRQIAQSARLFTPAMNALGHNLTHAPQQTASLFDYLVRTQQQRRRHLKSECLRSFYINDELEFGCLMKGHVTRISAFENLHNL